MKQTSIEWLLEKIEQKNGTEFSSYYVEFIEQAKEMHKQEIIDAWSDGAYGGGQFTTTHETSETYYKETFVSKGSDEAELPKQEISDISLDWNREVTQGHTIPTSSQQEILDGAKDTADYIDRHIIESMKELAKEGFKPKLSEISDEEINTEASNRHYGTNFITVFTSGAKWYREQLKNKL